MRYPRGQAIRVLTKVLSDHQTLEDAFESVSEGIDRSTAARAWLQEVCSGTLRWKGRLDLAIDSVALKKKPTGWLRKALLIAAYQLIAQDRTQPGAVVSETVSEVKSREGEAPAKFANACLRKLAEHGRAFRELEPETGASWQAQAQWASLPEWLWSRLRQAQGLPFAEAYARASLERPTLWGRLKQGATEPAGATQGPVPGAWYFAQGSGVVTELPIFREGQFFVQDISSQLLIHEMSETVRAKLGSTRAISVLDLCAAPGGKSAGLAWNGFDVTATDRPLPSFADAAANDQGAAGRFALLRQTLSRVAPQVRVIDRDQVSTLPNQDWVWVDAPCTGSGILRRHPEVRWLRQEKELAVLAKVQMSLLSEAWEKVRPGGFLTYSVCSVLAEEGPQRAQDFFKLVGVGTQKDPGLSFIKEWSLAPQLAPGGDGFWAILMQKPAK